MSSECLWTVYRGLSYENGKVVYIGITSRSLIERQREHSYPMFLEEIDSVEGTRKFGELREGAWVSWYEQHGIKLYNKKHVRKALAIV